MQVIGEKRYKLELSDQGIHNIGAVYWNLPTPRLYEEAIRRREAHLAHLGPLVVRTGQYTGRSPQDKYIVEEPTHQDKIWWGKVNQPIAQEKFDLIHKRMLAYLQGKDIFVQDCFAGADPTYRLPIRVITQQAWQSLFARDMFIQATDEELNTNYPEFTVICAPEFHAEPEVDGTRSEVFVILNFAKKTVLIGGTGYAGEIKKSIFTTLNCLLPQRDVLPMHCSANVGPDGEVAIFFGLSGTGKTTLSADPDRTLIGDDEHGWSENGVFNFEGGCYAKVIKLSPTAEPDIYATTRKFGTILENVGFDFATSHVDLDDASLTENTRAVYPISHIPNASRTGVAGHPTNIVMLTCDAFGVLPPISRLSAEQASYQFLSGYTAKVAGTERGVTEPQATFSTCFGAPFMALPPEVYANLLRDRIANHKVDVWLINTGWSGGPYGVGQRVPIKYTRAMVKAALSGALADVPSKVDPNFGVCVPLVCPGVPDEILDAKSTWSDKAAYDTQAQKLVGMFVENFKSFEDKVPQAIRDAGPIVK